MGMQDFERERGSRREGTGDQTSRFREGSEYDVGERGYYRQNEPSERGMDDEYETRDNRSGQGGRTGGREDMQRGTRSSGRGEFPRQSGGVEWSDWSGRSGDVRGEYRGERGYRGYRGERFQEGGAGNYGVGSSGLNNYGSNRGMGSSRESEEYGYGRSGSTGSEGRSNRTNYAGRGPKGYRRSDDRIEEEINEQLMRHPDIDPSEIEVKVQNGEVTLSGTVDNREAKRLAEDIAEASSGVEEVQNQIRVSKGQRNEASSEREVQRQVDKEGKRGALGGARTTPSSGSSTRSPQTGVETKHETTM